MGVDTKTFETLNRLIRKNPKNSQADWFVMGFLYAHPNNLKSLEEVFNTVNNITQLARDESLSIEESNDVLIRMMNNLSNSDRNKNKNLQKEPEVRSRFSSRSSERESPRKSEEISIKKTITPIKPAKVNSKGAVVEDDMSYKSDSDAESKKESPKETSRRFGEEISDEEAFKRYFGKAGAGSSKSNSLTIGFAKKPINQVDTSSLWNNKNLKRAPQIDEEEEEHLSLQLIKKIQEDDSKAQKVIDERDKRQEKELTEGICNICLGPLLDQSFIPLESCEHIFHESCFADYLKSEIQSRHFPINCPSHCGQEVSQPDMIQVLDPEIVAKFYEYSLKKHVTLPDDDISDDMSCCPTPGCSYLFYPTDNEHVCPLCKKKYCLDCRTEFQKGHSCKEFQAPKKKSSTPVKFEKFQPGKRFKQCPKCRLWVEKLEGYDHLTCKCRYQFCAKCGGKYRHCECVKKMQEEIERKQSLARQKQEELKNKKKKQ